MCTHYSDTLNIALSGSITPPNESLCTPRGARPQFKNPCSRVTTVLTVDGIIGTQCPSTYMASSIENGWEPSAISSLLCRLRLRTDDCRQNCKLGSLHHTDIYKYFNSSFNKYPLIGKLN